MASGSRGWVTAAVAVAVLAALLQGAVWLGNAPPVQPLACYAVGIGCPAVRIVGVVKPGWEKVLEAYAATFKAGYELGAQLSIFHHNEHVVDVVLGYADRTFTTPFANDTLQVVYSSSKVVESLVVAMLEDRGLLNYSAPVAAYWPEFAAGGKAAVTVGELMSHGGGVAGGFPRPLTVAMLEHYRHANDPEVGEILAATPLDPRVWRGTGGQGYHGITRGFFASQLVRRVDPQHRTLDAFARDEIMAPLSIDFRVGVAADAPEWGRVGDVHTMPWYKVYLRLIPDLMLPPWLTQLLFSDHFITAKERAFFVAMGTPGTPTHAAFSWPDIIADYVVDHGLAAASEQPMAAIESPSTHGFATGHALSRIAQVLANGGRDPVTGRTLLSRDGLARASELYPAQLDAVILDDLTFSKAGWGRAAHVPGYPNGTYPCVGWAGAGGSFLQWCADHGLAVGYVPNYYGPHILDWRAPDYLKAALAVVSSLPQAGA